MGVYFCVGLLGGAERQVAAAERERERRLAHRGVGMREGKASPAMVSALLPKRADSRCKGPKLVPWSGRGMGGAICERPWCRVRTRGCRTVTHVGAAGDRATAAHWLGPPLAPSQFKIGLYNYIVQLARWKRLLVTTLAPRRGYEGGAAGKASVPEAWPWLPGGGGSSIGE